MLSEGTSIIATKAQKSHKSDKQLEEVFTKSRTAGLKKINESVVTSEWKLISRTSDLCTKISNSKQTSATSEPLKMKI